MNIETEQKALDALIEKGINIPIAGRNYHFKEPTLGLLDRMTEIQLKMHLDENKLKEDGLSESRVIVHKNAKLAARVIAIMILGKKWKIRLLGALYSNWLLWKLTPSQLLKITLVLIQLNNTRDFINSIRLMSVARTTAPRADLVEKRA